MFKIRTYNQISDVGLSRLPLERYQVGPDVEDPNALILFLIIYVWTPPHFWALAIARRKDYAAVDIPMLPVTHGVRFTRWHIFFYTVLLVIVTTLPFLTGMSGLPEG